MKRGPGRVLATLAIVLLGAAVGCRPAYSSTGRLPAAFGATRTTTASRKRPQVTGNIDVGILHFDFPISFEHNVVQSGISFQQSELWVYLRLYCESGAGVSIRGFAGLYPHDAAFTAAAYFYKQPLDLQPALKLSVIKESASGVVRSWPLVWETSNNSNSDMGLWPLVGPKNIIGKLALQLEGSNIRHSIPMPPCAKDKPSSSSSINSSRSGGGIAIKTELDLDGVWNVVTTTDPNTIPIDTYARLLTLHHRYHQQLGFQGTLLRCNQHEAQSLAAMPHLQKEIAASRLILWPWIWPGQHNTYNSQPSRRPQAYFWQVPKNQLSMLAGYGRQLRLSYFDLDEYLVLPDGTRIQDATCEGKPLLAEQDTAVWSLARYAALCTNCTGEELACWQQANKHLVYDGLLVGGVAPQSSTAAQIPTVVSAAGNPATLPSGPASSVSVTSSPLQLTQCPCLLGKSVLYPVKVQNTKVHKTTPVNGQRVQHPDHQCGYLLHMQALISSKRPWHMAARNETLVMGQWVVGSAGGLGKFVPFRGSPAVLTRKQCLLEGSELLRRCTQN